MFAAITETLVKNLGAQGDLIYNENVNENIEMLTLVKVRSKTFWPVTKYTIIDQTLLDLLEEQKEPDYTPEYTEEVLTEDFKNLRGWCGGASAAAGVGDPELGLNLAKVKVSAKMDTVDGASPITLKKKTVDFDKLRKSCTDKKIKKKILDMLRVKETEKLTFVYQTVYNTAPVTFFDIAGKSSSVSAACKIFLTLFVRGNKNEATTFTVPKEHTFAYGLMEITTEDGTLGIPPRTRKVRQYNKGWWSISSDSFAEDSRDTRQQVKTEIKMKEALLQPLADLPESTRHDLLETLCELLDDRDALPLLLDQWSTGQCGGPRSQAVSSFMDLLETSNVSTPQKDAVHLLVDAMDTLPDGVPALLTTCSPDTLTVLNQLVSGLKEDGQAELPESPPPPLREEGEVRWAAELLCSTDDTLRELSEQWDRPEFPPEVLLEVLCLVVRGLSMMQPKTHS